jgi:hypothetical protein
LFIFFSYEKFFQGNDDLNVNQKEDIPIESYTEKLDSDLKRDCNLDVLEDYLQKRKIKIYNEDELITYYE